MLVDYLSWRLKRPDRVGLGPPSPSLKDWLEVYENVPPFDSNIEVMFDIVVDGTAATTEDVSTTVRSLKKQSHKEWNLTLLEEDSSPTAVASMGASKVAGSSLHPSPSSGGVRMIMWLSPGATLEPNALKWIAWAAGDCDVVYGDGAVGTYDSPAIMFKPGWSPSLLLSHDYLGPVAIRAETLDLLADLGARPSDTYWEKAKLRLVEVPGITIAHLPVLLSTRVGVYQPSNQVDRTRWVEQGLSRRGWTGYEILSPEGSGPPRPVFRGFAPRATVKVVIPTRDKVALLRRAIDGVISADPERRTHIVVVDNGSTSDDTAKYLRSLSRHDRIDVVRNDEPFNFSRLCNLGARVGRDLPFLLFLNNDVAAVDHRWLSQLLGWIRNDERAVAATPELVYPNGKIQYGGTVLGFGGIAGHYATGMQPSTTGLHLFPREVGAVTAACMLVRTSSFHEVGGFSEDLPVDFQDVDLSLKLRRAGGTLIYDPTFPLIHEESTTRGRRDVDRSTQRLFLSRWGEEIARGDPYYNPHLAGAQWDEQSGQWAHDPNRLLDLPVDAESALRRARLRKSDSAGQTSRW